MSHIPRRRRIAAALAGLACACLGLVITASAASAQVPGSPGARGMPASLIRAALLQGEYPVPASGSGSIPSPGTATAAAALATRFPSPNRGGIYDPVQTSHAAQVVTVTGGGMLGWQIALIAVGAALLAAMIAVNIDRARAARKTVITGPATCDQEASASFLPASSAAEHDVLHFP
jgi:hypothetical protein